MSQRVPRFRLLKRLALASGLLLALVAAGLLLLPLPVGWAINLGAAQALTAATDPRVRVAAGTFRWRLGEETAVLEVSDLDATMSGRPLARVNRLAVEIDKVALWSGHYAPREVRVDGLRLLVELAPEGALPAVTPGASNAASAPVGDRTTPKAEPAPLPSAAELSPLLPPIGGQTRVRLDDIRIDYVHPETRWALRANFNGTLVRPDADRARFSGALALGDPDRPAVQLGMEADVALASLRLDASLTLPEFRLSDLPKLPGAELPGDALIAISGRATLDLRRGEVETANGELSIRDGTVLIPGVSGGPIQIETVRLRGGATQRSGRLAVRLDEGVLAVEGLRVDVRRFEADVAAQTQVRWEVAIGSFAAAGAKRRVPDRLLAESPWIGGLLEALRLESASSAGVAELIRDANGALVLRTLEGRQKVALTLSDTTIAIQAEARQAGDAPIEITARVDPFRPSEMARAFPAEWMVASADFPLQIEANARVAADGALLDAAVKIAAAAGTLRAGERLPASIGLQQFALSARVTNGGSRFELPHLTAATDWGTLRLRDVRVQYDSPAAQAEGVVEVSGARLAALAQVLPASLVASLRAQGLRPDDFELRQLRATFAAGASDSAQGWQPVNADLQAELTLGVLGRELPVQLTASLPRGSAEGSAAVSVAKFTPADFGSRQVAGYALQDFRVPVQLQGTARFTAGTGTLLSATARLELGAGEVRLAEFDAIVPLQRAMVDGEYDFGANRVSVSRARIELAPRLAGTLENIRVTLEPLAAEGTFLLDPVQIADVLTWWPAGLLSEMRNKAAQARPMGTIRGGPFVFQFRSDPAGALQIQRLRGDLELSALQAQPSAAPGVLALDRAKLTLEFPAASLDVSGARAPGVELKNMHLRVPDVLAIRPLATLQANFTAELSAARAWAGNAAAELPAARGTWRGTLEASLPLTAEDLSGARAVLKLDSPDTAVAALVEGPLGLRFEVTAPDAKTLSLRGELALGGARWLGTPHAAGFSPIAVELEARDWRSSERVAATGRVDAENLLGLPLHLRGTAVWREAGALVERASLSEFAFGQTRLQATWQANSDHDAIDVRAAKIDVAELVQAGMPWLDVLAPAAVSAPVTGVANISSSAPKAAAAPGSVSVGPTTAARLSGVAAPTDQPALARPLHLILAADGIEFGRERRLSDVKLDTRLQNDWPEHVRFSAVEGAGRTLRATLLPTGAGQRLELVVADAAALAQTLLAPLADVKLPPGELAEMFLAMGGVPATLAGGSIAIEGDVQHTPRGLAGKGNFRLQNATMIQAPRLLTLLALRSGKSLEREPLIRQLQIDEWAFEPERVAVRGFALEGTGLIDRVKLISANYVFAGEKIGIDGAYFGIGFEIVGTMADPQVFLKENAVIRAIGQRNEFEFFEEDTTAPAAPKK